MPGALTSQKRSKTLEIEGYAIILTQGILALEAQYSIAKLFHLIIPQRYNSFLLTEARWLFIARMGGSIGQ
jgi:hypothetical protein